MISLCYLDSVLLRNHYKWSGMVMVPVLIAADHY